MASFFSPNHPFFKLFPVPDVLRMPAAGISIDDHAVRLMTLKHHAGKIRPGVFGTYPLPKGVVERGIVLDQKSLINVLVSLRKEHKLTFVRSAVPELQSYLFGATVPVLPPDQTRENVAFSLEEHVPVSAAEAVFDYIAIPSLAKSIRTSATKNTNELIVTALPKKIFDGYYGALVGAGLFPLSLEQESEAVTRALIRPRDISTIMIADISPSRTVLSIVSYGIVRFATTIDIGGEAINALLAKRFSVGEAELREMKQTDGITQSTKGKEMASALVGILSALKDEISKRFVYWNSHQAEEGGSALPLISRLLLSGEEASLKGLGDYLSGALRIPVELGNVWANCFSFEEYVPPIDLPTSFSYVAPIGLALRERD